MVPETTTKGERDGEQTTINVSEASREFDEIAGEWVAEMHDSCTRVDVRRAHVFARFNTGGSGDNVEVPEGFEVSDVRFSSTDSLFVSFHEVDR